MKPLPNVQAKPPLETAGELNQSKLSSTKVNVVGQCVAMDTFTFETITGASAYHDSQMQWGSHTCEFK